MMRWKLILAIALLVLGASEAKAGSDRVSPTLDITNVIVEITWIEGYAHMERVIEEYKGWRFAVEYARAHVGFSVLVRRDSEYVCRIFVRKPVRVDDRHMNALGHELMHCLAGDFHK